MNLCCEHIYSSFFFFFFLCDLGLLWVRSEPLLQLLKVFNGLEQLGEVSLTESPAAGALLDDLFGFRMHVAADALNDLQEERRPVSHRHSEHLFTGQYRIVIFTTER